MWPPTRTGDPAPWVFWAGLGLSGLAHLVFFGWLMFTLPGTPGQYRSEMVFWGGLLRPGDVRSVRGILGGDSPQGAPLPGGLVVRGAHGSRYGDVRPERPQMNSPAAVPPSFAGDGAGTRGGAP